MSLTITNAPTPAAELLVLVEGLYPEADGISRRAERAAFIAGYLRAVSGPSSSMEALRLLSEKAMLGPWQNGIEDLEGIVAPHNPGLGNVVCIPPLKNMYSSLKAWPKNAAFIVAAVNHVRSELARTRSE